MAKSDHREERRDREERALERILFAFFSSSR